MKLLYTALTALPALASAKVLLAVVEFQSIAVGDTYNVEWLVDSKMVRKSRSTFGMTVDVAESSTVAHPADEQWMELCADSI